MSSAHNQLENCFFLGSLWLGIAGDTTTVTVTRQYIRLF